MKIRAYRDRGPFRPPLYLQGYEAVSSGFDTNDRNNALTFKDTPGTREMLTSRGWLIEQVDEPEAAT